MVAAVLPEIGDGGRRGRDGAEREGRRRVCECAAGWCGKRRVAFTRRLCDSGRHGARRRSDGGGGITRDRDGTAGCRIAQGVARSDGCGGIPEIGRQTVRLALPDGLGSVCAHFTAGCRIGGGAFDGGGGVAFRSLVSDRSGSIAACAAGSVAAAFRWVRAHFTAGCRMDLTAWRVRWVRRGSDGARRYYQRSGRHGLRCRIGGAGRGGRYTMARR